MKKVKLDSFEIRVLINGLYQMRSQYDDQTKGSFEDLILVLIDTSERLKKGKRARLLFQNDEIRIIRRCLIDWRNLYITEGHPGAVDGINEVLLKFV